jgi:cysteinyl-tRNA synthetase
VDLKLFNTLTRKVENFKPIQQGRAGIYTCGPTVYDYPHIGNLRTYVFEDILRRMLEYLGYKVTHVMNVTDMGHLTDDADAGEDKIIKSAREKKMSAWEIAEYYTQAFFKDTHALNILEPSIICRATDHIADMIQLIGRLEEKGCTYTAGGNVYFDIDRFPGYGRLARLDLENLRAGARISVDPNKKNPFDFALWFTRSKFEHQAMLWDSPWGKGYPGWHIECSAMSMRYLGEQFDIHCGGVDHINVHHTNEIAQSEAATGKKWVNYWIHGEYLLMGSEKMAKSKGENITLPYLMEQGFHPLDYRYYLLGAHYRSQLQFRFAALEAARNARRRLGERIFQLKDDAAEDTGGDDPGAGYLTAFLKHAANDLNLPRSLSEVWALVRDEELKAEVKLGLLYKMDRILGLDFQSWTPEVVELAGDEEKLIAERQDARERKNFKRADEIRNILLKRGIILEDGSEGVRWRKKNL